MDRLGAGAGPERDIVITVAEGGGMFALDQATGEFLWARPFPYDDPNINMNGIDLKTGQTRVSHDKLFKKDGDHIIGCYHNTAACGRSPIIPQQRALRAVSGPVSFDDRQHQEPRGLRACRDHPPGLDPKYMNLARIDVATGELRVLCSSPQASAGSALVTAGDLVFWDGQGCRLRAFDADDGKVLWEAVVAGMVITAPSATS
jgi:outer membrane protein assembly factor BamB